MSLDEEPLDSGELAAFVRTVEAGSLSQAARVLGTPRATLSRRLARLEERLGARLLRRSSRSVVLTEEGRVLYERGKEALRSLRDAAESVGARTGALRGTVRVSLPPTNPVLNEIVLGFLAAHPEVSMDVTVTTASVRFADDAYDVALRATLDFDETLVRRPLVTHELWAVASPAYLAARGVPRSVADLSAHACLRAYARGEWASNEWPTPKGPVRVSGPLATNDLGMALDAARAGLGIALLPDVFVAGAVRRGELTRVLAGEVGQKTIVAIVYPERKLLRPVVRAFVEALASFGEKLAKGASSGVDCLAPHVPGP